MSETVELQDAIQTVLKRLPALMQRDFQAWDKSCLEALLKIAEAGINCEAPGLTSSQKADLQRTILEQYYNKLPTMTDRGNPIALLLQIAKRRTIDFLRSYECKHGSSIEAIEKEAEAQYRGTRIEALTNFETPRDELSQKERRAMINLVLDLIGTKCCRLLVGAYLDDRSYRELANDLSASEDDVDNWIRDCKKRWKKQYKQLLAIDRTEKEEVFVL